MLVTLGQVQSDLMPVNASEAFLTQICVRHLAESLVPFKIV